MINKEETLRIESFKKIQDEKVDIYIRKNRDYGNSFDKSLDEDGLLVAKIRMMDKLNRFARLISNDSQVTDETLRDTLIDLSNYADMAVRWMDEKDVKKIPGGLIHRTNMIVGDEPNLMSVATKLAEQSPSGISAIAQNLGRNLSI